MDQIDAAADNSSLQRRSKIGEVVTALVVILIGLAFLADNFGIHIPFFGLHNWWALFILIGAASPAAHALDRYRNLGTFDGQVLHSMLSTLAVVAVALMFLLDVSFALWWPVFVIIGGLYMLFPGNKGRDRK